MNCYTALRINEFSCSWSISSGAFRTLVDEFGVIYGTQSATGTGGNSYVTPFTNFTNRELVCRNLLDYRVQNDPEIAAKGWLIRKGLFCENCELEGQLLLSNESGIPGTITTVIPDIEPDVQDVTWGGLSVPIIGPWYNGFQYCKRLQQKILAAKPDPYVFITGGGAHLDPFTVLEFKLYNALSGGASDAKSFSDGNYISSAQGSFGFNLHVL